MYDVCSPAKLNVFVGELHVIEMFLQTSLTLENGV